MAKNLTTAIQYLKGIGPKRALVFKNMGISTIEDLLYYFPKRYEDRTNFVPVAQLEPGLIQTIRARVLVKGQRSSFKRRGFVITEAVVGDDTGKIACVWFNQPYLKDYLKVGEQLILFGKVDIHGKGLQMSSPEFEIISGDIQDSLNINRLVPIYSLPQKFTQRHFRQLIKEALDDYLTGINDFLPYDIRSRNNLLNLAKALINIHFPEDAKMRWDAYERLSFDEFFLFQLPLVLRKLKNKNKPGIAHAKEGGLIEYYIRSLPFRLTAAQERVIGEIKTDMQKPYVMQRLLQGDVGSGKTVVAVIAALIAIQGNYQVAFMAPTEILARQHYDNISRKLSVLSRKAKEIKVGLLTSSANKKEKDKIYQEIKEGKIDLIIGTHALLEESVKFNKLGLVVIDEQHKFGVGQRALLLEKGMHPDVLIMTATPIPRTLAITLYGDLDISIINELPPGRQVIKTLSLSEEERKKAYEIAKGQLRQGLQVYIIYPVIEESFALDILGAKKMYASLRDGEFKDYRLGLVHGKQKDNQQQEIMLKFKRKELDILVSTTVLEVGIDMPDATCMIIEHAQRFGLAQLHQLRGRIGRSDKESFCILLSNPQTEGSKSRIAALVKYSDGFHIAEEDLKIRGPGEFFGIRQHGLTELKIANPLTQMQLLKRAREEALKLVNQDSGFISKSNLPLKEKLLQRFPEYETLMMVG